MYFRTYFRSMGAQRAKVRQTACSCSRCLISRGRCLLSDFFRASSPFPFLSAGVRLAAGELGQRPRVPGARRNVRRKTRKGFQEGRGGRQNAPYAGPQHQGRQRLRHCKHGGDCARKPVHPSCFLRVLERGLCAVELYGAGYCFLLLHQRWSRILRPLSLVAVLLAFWSSFTP